MEVDAGAHLQSKRKAKKEERDAQKRLINELGVERVKELPKTEFREPTFRVKVRDEKMCHGGIAAALPEPMFMGAAASIETRSRQPSVVLLPSIPRSCARTCSRHRRRRGDVPEVSATTT